MCNEEYTNINPKHYRTGKFECIEVMEEALGSEAVKGFCLCNAFKYIYRHNRKNGDEDIEKAIWYLNHYMKIVNREKEESCEHSESCTDDEWNKLFDLSLSNISYPNYHDYLEKIRQDPLNFFTKRMDFALGCTNCSAKNIDSCPGKANCRKFKSFCDTIGMNSNDILSKE